MSSIAISNVAARLREIAKEIAGSNHMLIIDEAINLERIAKEQDRSNDRPMPRQRAKR